jgi:hypothetical protein
MLKPFLFVFKELEGGKRIPRGGLGTNGMLAITETPAWSPSHTVGSEQKDKGFVKVFHAFIKSPSHAVGLELLTEPWHRVVVCKSPSHTVGLEQGGDGVLPLFPRKVGVTIPRSGLGTRRKGGGI